MYVIRETFVAKPGQASKLARLMKEAIALTPNRTGMRLLTDFVGPFNTVVIESEVADFAQYEAEMRTYMTDPRYAAFRDKMAGYTDMYVSGKREIWRLVD